MTAAHRRAARREREAAALLGSRRVHRSRYERAPDVEPVRLSDGTVLLVEVKTRLALPLWLVAAVEQARGYGPGGAVPVVALSQLGSEALAVLPLQDLARLLGLRSPRAGEQLVLFGGGRDE